MDVLAPVQRSFAECLRTAAWLAVLAVLAVMPLLYSGRAIPAREAATGVADPTPEAAEVPAAPVEEAVDPASRALVDYLSRRYHVDRAATGHLVSAARDAGWEVGLDPLVILAVIAIESRFNPIAESVAGAKGLMQIIPRMHQDKLRELGGAQVLLDPVANIRAGARILREFIDREGSLEAGLQFYNGASADPTARYSQKVLAEMARLRQTLSDG